MNIEEFLASPRLRVGDKTKKAYRSHLTQVELWLANRLYDRELTEDTAQEHLDWLTREGKAPNSVASRANAIRLYFKVMHRKEIILDAPRVTAGDPKYLPIEVIYKLLEASKTPIETCIVTVLFDTGIRINDLLQLQTSDIDWENGFLHLRQMKGGRSGDVNISGKALESLQEWLDTRAGKQARGLMDYNYWDIRTILNRITLNLRYYQVILKFHLLSCSGSPRGVYQIRL